MAMVQYQIAVFKALAAVARRRCAVR